MVENVIGFEELVKMWGEPLEIYRLMLENLRAYLETGANLLNSNAAIFRCRVQSGGRISIPEADRSALNIKEGDIVKVIVIKEKGGEKDGV